MRKKLTSMVISLLLAGGASVALTAAPAEAAPAPVKAGKDSCGNFNVWINGQQLIYYVWCGPDPR